MIKQNTAKLRRIRKSQLVVTSSKTRERWDCLLTMVAWARSEYFVHSTGGMGRSIDFFLKRITRVYYSRGTEQAISFCKRGRLVFIRWLASEEDSPEWYRWRRRARRFLGRFPFDKGLKTAARRDSLRSVLTALIITRSLSPEVTFDSSSITGESTKTGEFLLGRSVRRFWKELRFGPPTIEKDRARASWKRFHISTKAGPNGPAMWTALEDLRFIPETLLESISLVGGKTMRDNLTVLLRNLPSLRTLFPWKEVGGHIRKVIAIPDMEKSRNVAILDYWSQSSLRPLHLFLSDVLKKIPQDVTFDQGAFTEKTSQWVTDEYQSIDLSKATDRFPITLISEVLEGAFTKEFVKAWQDIMVGYPFMSPVGEISYSVGNPMGAYSSWASFAVAHHCLVWHCCWSLGKNPKTAQYVILGDDVLFGDRVLAEEYQRCLATLGVLVSQEKTIVSKDTLEFAKRWVHKGEEITPFPLSSLIGNLTSIPRIVSSLISEERRELLPKSGIPGAVKSLFKSLHYKASITRRKVAEARSCELAFRFSQGSLDGFGFIQGLLWNEMTSGSKTDQSTYREMAVLLDQETSHFLIKKAVERMFADSLSSSHLDLGQMAVDLVERFTGRDPRFEIDGFDLLYAVPFLGCYGQVEEMYMEALRDHTKVWDRDDVGDLTRGLMIPMSDQVFTVPIKDQKMVVRAKFAACVLEEIRRYNPRRILSSSSLLVQGMSRTPPRALHSLTKSEVLPFHEIL